MWLLSHNATPFSVAARVVNEEPKLSRVSEFIILCACGEENNIFFGSGGIFAENRLTKLEQLGLWMARLKMHALTMHVIRR